MSGVCFSRAVVWRLRVGGRFRLAYEAFPHLVEVCFDGGVLVSRSFEVGIDLVGADHGIGRCVAFLEQHKWKNEKTGLIVK